MNKQEFYEACKTNNMEIVRKQLQEPQTGLFLFGGMRGAIQGGHLEIVTEIAKRFKEELLNASLYLTCKAQNSEIIEFLLEKGAAPNCGLMGACEINDLEVIAALMNRGANSFNKGFLRACEHNNLKAAEMMFAFGASSFQEGLTRGCAFPEISGFIKKINPQLECKTCNKLARDHD